MTLGNLRRSISLYVALATATLTTAACASSGRLAAIKLADDGVAASNETKKLLALTSETLNPYVEGQFLTAPLRGTDAPDEALLSSIEKVNSALSVRVSAMSQLAKCYGALKDYASYDASAAVEKSVSDLAGSISAYAAVVAPGTVLISGTAATLASKAAGGVAGRAQLTQLKAASRMIREQIRAFRELLVKESDLLESIGRVTTSTSATNARMLWELGIGQPDSILSSALAANGLDYDAKTFPDLMKSLESVKSDKPAPDGCAKPCDTQAARLRFGVSQVVRQRAIRSIDLSKEAVANQADTLQALEDAHRDFEADAFVDNAAIATELEMLKSTVDALVAAKGK